MGTHQSEERGETVPKLPKPSPKPVPTPPPPAKGPKDLTALKAALIATSSQYIIPINRLSALYKYAKSQKLGEFLSAEFSVTCDDVDYRAQVFEKGIAYFAVDNPENIDHITVLED